MSKIIRDRNKRQEGQRMSYASAQKEMERDGWEYNDPNTIALYSFLGKNEFMKFMVNITKKTDILMDYLRIRTGNDLKETPLRNKVHSLYMRLDLTSMIKNIGEQYFPIGNEQSNNRASTDFRMSVPNMSESEIMENYGKHFDSTPPQLIGNALESQIRNLEGKSAEFGFWPQSISPKFDIDSVEVNQMLKEGNEILENRVEVWG